MMKKLLICSGVALCTYLAPAQTINFCNGQITYSFPAATVGEMEFAGETVTAGDRNFTLSEWSKITVNENTVSDNTVEIVYSDNTATVTIAGNVARYIDASTSGAHVSITQSDEVSENTCGEITYILKGESADGSLTLTGSYKSTLELQGLTLTNPSGAAMNIQNGKRIAVSAKNGTENSLTDGAGSQKGAIDCKGHLELKGKGTLNVKGNKSHAVYAKEYVEIKNLTLNITGAAKDGINCAQYFLMESGTVNISNTGDDGINSSKDFRISGGDITVISIVGDGLDSNGNLTISGGYIRTMGSGGAEMGLDAATEEGYAVYITGGTILAFGGSNTYPTKSSSTQAFVNISGSIKADSEIAVKSGTETLATFTVPAEYNSSNSRALYGPGNGPGGGGWNPGGGSGSGSLMISCPQLQSGQSYTVVNDTASTSTTAKLTGSGR